MGAKNNICDYRDRCLLIEKRIYFDCFAGMLCHQVRHCVLKCPYIKPIVRVQYELF